jgi:O-antigen ligase
VSSARTAELPGPPTQGILALRAPLRLAVLGAAVGAMAAVTFFGYVPGTQKQMYGVLVLCILLYLLARGEKIGLVAVRYLTSPMMRLRWLFLIWALGSLFWLDRGGGAVERASTLIQIHVVGLLVYDAARHLEGLSRILVVTFFSAAAGIAVAFATGIPQAAGRLEGWYGNPNTLSLVALMGLSVFYAGELRRLGRAVTLSSLLLSLLLCAGVLASSSVKGAIGLVVLWALALVLRRERPRLLLHAGLAAAIGALLVWRIEILHDYWIRMQYRIAAVALSLLTTASFGASFAKRERFVRRGFDLMASSPVFGHGLDSFRWLSGEQTYAHNNYVDLGVALGLVGLVLYYGFYATILWGTLSRVPIKDPRARFAVLFVVVLAVLDFGAVSYPMKLPSLLLIACAGWLDGARDGRGSSEEPISWSARPGGRPA